MRSRTTLRLGHLLFATLMPAGESDTPPRPLFAATYYTWSRWPDRHLGKADTALPLHVTAPAAADPTQAAWHERELDDAAAAGIDALLIANVPAPTPFDSVLAALSRALERRSAAGATPVRVGLLIDPFFVAVEQAGGETAVKLDPLDLRDAATRAAFLAPLDAFCAAIAPPFRATLEERLLVVVGNDALVGTVPPDFFDAIEQVGPERFGTTPLFVIEQSWGLAERPQWRRRATLAGLQQTGAVATLGPGFLDAEAARGLIRPLASRAQFLADAAPLLRVPRSPLDLLLLDSWNQLDDGSALAPTLESGTRYVGALRELREAWSAPSAPPFAVATPNAPLLAHSFAADRDLVLRDAVDWSADGAGRGIVLRAIEPDAAAAAARFEEPFGGRARLALPAGGHLRFELAAPFRSSAPNDYELTLEFETLSAADPAAPFEVAVGGREATPVERGGPRSIAGWVTRDAPTFELIATAPCALRSLRWRRREATVPTTAVGIDLPTLLTRLPRDASERANVTGRLAVARDLGARWLRVEVPWASLEPTAGARDFSALVELLTMIRSVGLEPIVALTRPPNDASPLPAHSSRAADFVAALLTACGDRLQLLELFPRGNVPGAIDRAPDLAGQMRVMREIAARMHSDFPHIAIALGAIAGNAPDWWSSIHGLREPYSYDLAALEVDASLGRRGSATFERSLQKLVAAARQDEPDRRWIVSVDREPPPIEAADDVASAYASRAIAAGLEASGHSSDLLHLLDSGELPRVDGVAMKRAKRWLEATGRPVVVQSLRELLTELRNDTARCCVLASGEWLPCELMEALPEWLDRGGLLITLGGVPGGRSARRREDGSFDEEGSALAPGWREALGIARLRARPAMAAKLTATTLAAGVTFPGLLDGLDAKTPPPFAAWFERRTGQPRDPRSHHRYDELIRRIDGEGNALGDGAALLRYAGGRAGSLLMVGLADGGGELDDAAAALALRHDLAAARRSAGETGTAIVLWRLGVLEELDAATMAAAAFRDFAAEIAEK